MENLYLNADESILLTTQNIIVDGIRHEAVLTDTRLILVRIDDPKAPHREIPLAGIGSAIAGENALREPTITLAITAPDGVLQTVQLVFIRLVSEQKNPQFTEWVERLKERIRVTVKEPEPACAGPAGEIPAHEKGVPKELEIPSANQDPCANPDLPAYVFRPPKPVHPQNEGFTFSKILTVIIVFAVVIVGALIAAQLMNGNGSSGTTATGVLGVSPEVTPVHTKTATAVPTPLLTTVPATPATPATPQVMIPSSGIWVRVQYAGSFTGSVGTSGRMREINSTGDKFYQIPATEGIIIAEVQKKDGSGDPIAVELYKSGKLVKRIDSTNPNAIILINEVL